MKVAIVCDWLVGLGGAERVVLELHKLYPDAPIYTSQYDPKNIDWFRSVDVRTTWLQKLPKGLKKFLPVLRAWSFSRLDLSQYDLIISASGAEAKGVKKRANAVHISYCHAPTHYYWSRYQAYLSNPGFPTGLNWLARLGLKLLVGPLRAWDKKAAQRPDYLIANSTHTQAEIKKYYNRDATVVHPPVEIARFKPKSTNERHGFVAAGRQTPYKKIGLAVEACTKLELPLTVVGNGPEHAKLQHMAGPSITFVGEINDDKVPATFQAAQAFIFPGLDDFGIVAVEAMAAGTPVIAYQAGGALDYVVEGKTGVFFADQDATSLAEAIQKFERLKFDATQVSSAAEKFSAERFRTKMQNFIASKTKANT